MSLSQENGGGGYASAFDVAQAGVADAKGTNDGPPPPPVEPKTEGETQGTGDLTTSAPEQVDEAKLSESILVTLIDGPPEGMLIDDIDEQVKAIPAPGARPTKGQIEARLVALKGDGKVELKGDRWAVADRTRGEVVTPRMVISRRATLLRTLLVAGLPDTNAFNLMPGKSVTELGAFLAGEDSHEDDPTGAVTASGFLAEKWDHSTLTSDLKAMVEKGLLIERDEDAEDAIREGRTLEEDAEDHDDPAEAREEEDDDPPDSRDLGEEEDVGDEAAAEEKLGPFYALRAETFFRVLADGAASVAAMTVPEVPPAVVAAAVAAGKAADRSAYEQAATRRAEAAERGIEEMRRREARIRTHLATLRLEYLVDAALGPPAPPPPERPVIHHTQTVPMDDKERAILLREVAENEDEINVEKAKIEGAKAHLKAVKTAAEEKLAELENRKATLLSSRTASQRTYVVEAYNQLVAEGDAESNGVAVNLIRACDDNRILDRKVLAPRELLAAAAGVEPQTAPGAPPPPPNPAPMSAPIPMGTTPSGPTASITVPIPTPGTVVSPLVAATHMLAVKSFLTAHGRATAETIAQKTGLPLPTVNDLLSKLGAEVGHEGLEFFLTAPAPVEDDAAKAAREAEAARAAAVTGGSKLAGPLNAETLQPVILGLVIEAGVDGQDEAKLSDLVAQAAGVPLSSGITTTTGLAVRKLIGKRTLERTGDRLHYGLRAAVLGLFANHEHATSEELPQRFEQATGIKPSLRIRTRLDEILAILVAAQDLESGPMPDDKKVIMFWMSGDPDPRPEPTAPAAVPEPKARGKRAQAGTAKAPAAKKSAATKTSAKKKK